MNFKEITREYLPDRPSLYNDSRLMRKIADFLEKNRLTAESFWRFFLTEYGSSQTISRIVGSDKVLNTFLEYRKNCKEKVKRYVYYDLRKFYTELDFQAKVNDVFEKKKSEISPCTLYVMACVLELPKYQEQFRAKAVRQILEEPWLLRSYPEQFTKYLPIKEKKNETVRRQHTPVAPVENTGSNGDVGNNKQRKKEA